MKFRLLIIIICITLAGTVYAEKIDPRFATVDPDGKTLWYDCKLLTLDGKGWSDTESYYDRLPQRAKEVVTPQLWNLSRQTAGMRVRFITDTTSLKIHWVLLNKKRVLPHMTATAVSGIDIYEKNNVGKWVFYKNGNTKGKHNAVILKVFKGKREYMLNLPLYNGLKSIRIGLPPDTPISRPETSFEKKKPIVFYGTSITQGASASRPGMACTAIISRKMNVPVINLGFSGSGRMEPELADLLAELDPAVYVLDCLWNMTLEMISERVASFVVKLYRAHPKTPILLLEDSNFRNETTKKGRALRAEFKKLKNTGITNIYLVPNYGMLGEDMEATVDRCHPTDLGMMRMAGVIMKFLAPLVK